MSSINEAQSEAAVGPHLYDMFMNTQEYCTELEKTRKYSPRIEEILGKLKTPENMRKILDSATETLLQATKATLSDRKFSMEVLKELRAWHPNNLNLVSHSQSDYPKLFASNPEIASHWATYCRMAPTNFPKGGGEALQAWWAGHK